MPSYIKGKLYVPASKSVAHRVLIASALADKPTRVKGFVTGEDTAATMDCLISLGADISVKDKYILVKPIVSLPDAAELNARESGSTYRFMLPIAAALGVNAYFTLAGKLGSRPIEALTKVLEEHGAAFNADDLSIKGKLTCGTFKIDASISSQYITGLLFALPLLDGDSEIVLENEAVSESYIEITLRVLNDFGVKIEKRPNGFFVKGNQKYVSPHAYTVEGDWSSASFFACMGAIAGDVTLKGMDVKSTQGDRVVLDLIKEAGGRVSVSKSCVRVKKSQLHGIEFSCKDCPDLVPTVASMLAFADGESKIFDADRLKVKECDRLDATTKQLNAVGIEAANDGRTLVIKGGKVTGGTVNSQNDHRMAMSTSVLAAGSQNGVIIEGADAVKKSYPQFFAVLKKVGGVVK